jgi:anthranilate synthase component 1
MFFQGTFEEFKKAAEGQKRAVVLQEFPCDEVTPARAFIALDAGEGAVLLESAVRDQEMGRFSVLAIEPFARFTSSGPKSSFMLDGMESQSVGAPYERLREVVSAHRLPSPAYCPPLVGGAIGFATYDAVRLFEEVPDRHKGKGDLPDLFFLFHAVHITFDHSRGSLCIAINVKLTGDPERDFRAGQQKIEEIRGRIKDSRGKKTSSSVSPAGTFTEEMSDAEFCEKVGKAKEHLFKGDAFQIVLSRTFSCPFKGDPFDIYRALRMTNPSPFMFYLQMKEFAIAGASPERLVKLEEDHLQTMPIAGTRPRIQGEEDKTVLELLQDLKEDAEHMMLVDLGRNDLGIVAEVGSVKVKELKAARYFPHVIHLVSQIEARIKQPLDCLDVLKAVFPAGTLSGAPKIRAMEIIDSLESSRRGIYGGAICTIDNRGNFDSCIVIRTAFIKDAVASVRAGAGIVFDSDPQREAEETRAKAKGVMQAIQLAMEGIL